MIPRSSDERGPDTRSALDRLIGPDAPASPAVFARRHWGRLPLLTRARDLPAGFDDLLSVDAVDELLSRRGVRTPFMRMARNGSLTDPSTYTGSGGFGAEVTDQIDSAGVLAAFAEGHTVVLQGLHRLWPPIIDFTGRLVPEVGHPVQVNSYITPASSRGFDPHYDVHDVFVLQVSGEKRWIVHPPVHEHPLADQPWSDRRDAVTAMAATPPTVDTVLREGDSLYIPRGWIHSAEALGATSIHLTVGISAFTRHDLLRHLVSTLADEPSMRAPLPLGTDLTDTDAVAAHVGRAMDDLVELLGSSADSRARSVAARVSRRFDAVTRPEPVRPLATIEAMDALTETSVVSWRRGLHATVTETTEGVMIVTRIKTITLPAECAAAVRQLHSGKPCALVDLVGLDRADALVVVRRLLRESVVVPQPL